MNWLIKISQQVNDYSNQESSEELAHTYFNIGHGDYVENLGFEPLFLVWMFYGGQILTSGIMMPEGYDETEEHNEVIYDHTKKNYEMLKDKFPGPTGTHGVIWGHGIADSSYKGRYEPETGRLSIVKPERNRYRDVPSSVMNALYRRFDKITDVSIF